MSVQVENLEKNMARLTVEASAEEFEKALQTTYEKQRKNIALPGFRKGKAPRKMVEKMYGAGIFYQDAADIVINATYEEAAKESGLDIVSRPDIEVTQIEQGKSFIYTATVAVRPEVKLGEYKGLEAEAEKVEVTEEEVEAELKKAQENGARTVEVTDRAVEDGDIAVIDFEGFVDGVAFDGGKGENHELTIGSHSFIDTFEEQLIGKNIGESCDVNVTFPEQYQAEELAGKAAVFKVTVNAIKKKELPELDDEFASEVSDFETLDEYKKSLKEQVKTRKEADVKSGVENTLVDMAIDNAEFDIPDAMLDTEARAMVDDFAQRIQYQGMTMDMYLQYTGMTAEDMVNQMKPQATRRISTRLVLEAIAKAEGLNAGEEEINAEVEKMAKDYGMEASRIRDIMGENGMKQMENDLAVQKAIDLLYTSAKITEKEAAAEEAAAE